MSTRFIDGPAAGKILELSRTPMPLFLRVTKDKDGKIDALDQLDDEPQAGEELFVYIKASDDGSVHLSCRDAKTGRRYGRFMQCSTYALFDEQPEQAVLSDSKGKWPAWCKATFERRKAAREAKQAEDAK